MSSAALALAILGIWATSLWAVTRPIALDDIEAQGFRGRRTVVSAESERWWIDPVGKQFEGVFLVMLFGGVALVAGVGAVWVAGPSIIMGLAWGLVAAGCGWLAAGPASDLLIRREWYRGRRVEVGEGQVVVETFDGYKVHRVTLGRGLLELVSVTTRTVDPEDELHYEPGAAPVHSEEHHELRLDAWLIGTDSDRVRVAELGRLVAAALGRPLRTRTETAP